MSELLALAGIQVSEYSREFDSPSGPRLWYN
jgi:hypothetical protein